MSLIQQAKSGLLWSAVSRFGLNGLIFVKGIILARLLGPEDFGLLAMVSVFTVIATGVTDFGFSQSVIQKRICRMQTNAPRFMRIPVSVR